MIDPVQFLHVQNAVGYIKVILFYKWGIKMNLQSGTNDWPIILGI